MNIFKISFSFDYPTNSNLIDHLGENLENILEQFRINKDHFSLEKADYEVYEHFVNVEGSFENNNFELKLSPTLFSGYVDYTNNTTFEKIEEQKIFKVIDNTLKNLILTQEENIFNLRILSIIEQKDTKFEKILCNMLKANGNSFNFLTDNETLLNNILFSFNLRNEKKNENIQIYFGPYGKEQKEYFYNEDSGFKTGIWYDIGISKYNITVTDFKVSQFIMETKSKLKNIIIEISKRNQENYNDTNK